MHLQNEVGAGFIVKCGEPVILIYNDGRRKRARGGKGGKGMVCKYVQDARERVRNRERRDMRKGVGECMFEKLRA